MRFKAGIQNIHTFTKFTASLASLGHLVWIRLDSNDVRFTVVPEQGTQVWSVIAIDTIFETYQIQSASENDMINLEVPLQPLLKALKSARSASAANIRLTKKDGVPLLSLTITTLAMSSSIAPPGSSGFNVGEANGFGIESASADGFGGGDDFREGSTPYFGARPQDRETTVTQDIPIRVLAPASVEGLHEPRCRAPEVHISLPNLMQLKSISDRFTRLALSTKTGSGRAAVNGPKLELSGNMHGCLRLRLNTDSLRISSLWTGLENPELDPNQVAEGIEHHPSTRMKELGDATGQSEEGWATVRLEGRDWGRVLSVGRMGGKVIACFCHEHALILYVYIGGDDGVSESVLTYYISSYSA